MAGTLKVGGVTLATHSDATAKVSLDSGLTFPAGHVIQTVWNTKSDEASTSTNSTTASITIDGSGNEEWFVNISNLTIGNKVLLTFHFPAKTNSSDNLSYSGFGICRDTISNHIYSASTARYGILIGAAGLSEIRSYLTLVYIDTPTSSSHTYKLTQRSTSTGDYTTVDTSVSSPATFIAQEIQQ